MLIILIKRKDARNEITHVILLFFFHSSINPR
jgi:hypothetical protein